MRTDFEIERVAVDADRAHLRAIVPSDLVYFEGHFEGRPMLPGVAEVLLLADRRAREVFPGLGAPRRMARVKFEAVIKPGDRLDVHLERSANGDETRVEWRILRDATRCATGVIVYA